MNSSTSPSESQGHSEAEYRTAVIWPSGTGPDMPEERHIVEVETADFYRVACYPSTAVARCWVTASDRPPTCRRCKHFHHRRMARIFQR